MGNFFIGGFVDKVRFGVIGIGGMGGFHCAYLHKGEVEDASLAAVCDINEAKLEACGRKYEVPTFVRYQDMCDSGKIDAVIIATPHYFHPEMAIAAFAHNVHVLSEKPVAVDVKEARKVNDLYSAKYSHLKYGAMFQARTNPVNQKVRELIASGELGEVRRMTWVATDWFRTWTYYASGGWRATWAGEGGGVLLNQCPHNLDQMQWLLGGMMPERVTAVASIAKTHPIEVEDEVSAIMEYPNGAIGHFITSTGETPGSNRLEFVGDRGRLVAEDGKLRFRRTRQSVHDVLQNSPESFAHVETWDIEVPLSGPPEAHKLITQNFVNSLIKNEPLIAPGVEGVKGLELGNAMLMAGLTRKPVSLPMNGDAYQAFLKDLIVKYGGKKTLGSRQAVVDMDVSFKK